MDKRRQGGERAEKKVACRPGVQTTQQAPHVQLAGGEDFPLQSTTSCPRQFLPQTPDIRKAYAETIKLATPVRRCKDGDLRLRRRNDFRGPKEELRPRVPLMRFASTQRMRFLPPLP